MAQKVLFVRFSSLGDVLLTSGIIRLLKQHHPEIIIDFITAQEFLPLLKNNPHIHRVYTIDRKRGTWELIKKYLELPKYDHIFDLHNSVRSWLLRLFTIGHVHTYNKKSSLRRKFIKNKSLAQQLQDHVTERYFAPVKTTLNLPTPTLEELRPEILPPYNEKLPPLPENFICLHPFASQRNKVWPYFKELCIKLMANGLTPVVIGQGHWPSMPEVIDLTNTTSLEQTMAIIKKSSLLISTDSGPLHIGCALKTPIIGIFGPTTREFGFFPLFNQCHIIEEQNLECRPCHPHGGQECPMGHFKCMKNISAEIILQKTLEILNL